MTATGATARGARHLLNLGYDGILSTHSIDVPGYPFGSVMPYCLDRGGYPIIMTASIAQHTKNILSNSKVSLIVMDRSAPDLQASGRLTLLGDAVLATDTDAIERYLQYYPDAREYRLQHDFAYYRIDVLRARYIGGFGNIHWVAATDLLQANPFDHAAERQMIDHMNADHAEAMRHYCNLADVCVPEGVTPHMAGVDADGFHLRIGPRLVRFPFERPVGTPTEVREMLVTLARAPLARTA